MPSHLARGIVRRCDMRCNKEIYENFEEWIYTYDIGLFGEVFPAASLVDLGFHFKDFIELAIWLNKEYGIFPIAEDMQRIGCIDDICLYVEGLIKEQEGRA